MDLLPNTVSARDIQRNYRKIFDRAKRSKKPIVVMTNKTPDVVIMDVKELEDFYTKAQQAEVREALQAIKLYKREKRAGKLKILPSLKDLR